jgi:hypothetical protein
MIRAVIGTALWIGVVDALAGLAVLAFLYTPESNVLMLGASALLLVVVAMLLMLSSTSAAHGLVHRQAPWRSVPAAMRLLPLVLVGLLVAGAICGSAGGFESWWLARAGEVDAAAIAAGDVTNTRPLHTAVRWLVMLVQWVLVPAWLATCLAWVSAYDRRDVLSLKWLGAGLHWRVLLVTALGVGLLVWLPWRYVYWRPRALPASSLEVVFGALKIGLIYLMSQIAWALTLCTAASRVVSPPTSVPPPDA